MASRRAVATELGATAVCGGDPAEVKQAVFDATRGAGAEVVIVSVGLGGLTELALPIAAKQGAINLFAGFPPDTSAAGRRELPALQRDRPDRQSETRRRTSSAARPTCSPPWAGLDRLTTHRFAMADAAGAYTTRDDPDALKTIVFPGGLPR